MPTYNTVTPFHRRIQKCPVLGSLRSVNNALSELTQSSDCHSVQVAEIIRKDPSLTTRLLRLVNSVYTGLQTPVDDLETAVFYLGIRGIRHLSLSTRLIDDLSDLPGLSADVNWRQVWKHSISSGYLSREILSLYGSASTSDMDYLVGLLHNVGKIVMAYAFKDEFAETLTWKTTDTQEFAEKEMRAFGWDHSDAGGEYLRLHGLAEEIIAAVKWHNNPSEAGPYAHYAAAAQVADVLVRYSGIDCSVEELDPVETDSWLELDGWKILFPDNSSKTRIAQASLKSSIERIPMILQGMV